MEGGQRKGHSNIWRFGDLEKQGKESWKKIQNTYVNMFKCF